MRSFEVFVLSRPEIRQAVFYWDTGCPREELMEFLRRTTIEKLTLTGPAAEQLGRICSPDKSWQVLPFEEVLADKEPVEALIFAGVWDIEPLFRMKDRAPELLAGSVMERGSFSIWEQFRTVTRTIHVDTVREAGPDRVLQWERGRETALSVILPVYNVEAYLSGCLESLTAWKAEYAEFLCIDDGSTDGSGEILRTWAARDPRIRVIHKPNGGCASARQMGLEQARGSYVGFVDPDDFVDPAMFHRLLEQAMTGSFEVSFCGYQEYYTETGQARPVPELPGDPVYGGITDRDRIRELACRLPSAIWRGIYSRELLRRENISFLRNLPRFDDLPFKVEVFLSAGSVIAVPEYLYYYRLQRPGQDVAADDRRLFVHFRIFDHLNRRILPMRDQQTRDILQLCKIQTHRYAIEKLRRDYLREYAEKAGEDLYSSGSFWRTVRICRQELGRKSLLCCLGLLWNQPVLLLPLRIGQRKRGC